MVELRPSDNTQAPAQSFRILCIDGGGVRGAFAAAILEAVEERFFDGDAVINHCDLVAGTSTGGLIALSLAFSKRPKEIRIFYEERAKELFPESLVSYYLAKAKQFVFAPYSQITLESVVGDFLGKEQRFGNANVRLVIPTYNATEGNVHVFTHLLSGDEATVKGCKDRKYNLERYKQLDDLPVTSVAAATAAAPTFFPAKHISERNAAFIDGGVWANSPIWPAIAEATGPLGRRLDQTTVLSVGTRFERVRVGLAKRRGGFLPWNWRVLELLTNAQASGAIGGARWALGSRFLRIDDERKLEKGEVDPPLSLDRVKAIPDLVKRGYGVVEKNKEEIGKFLEAWRRDR